VKHDDADLRERALGDAGTYFFRENEGRLAAIAAYFAHLPGGPDDGANDFLGLGLQHGFVVYAEPPWGHRARSRLLIYRPQSLTSPSWCPWSVRWNRARSVLFGHDSAAHAQV